MTKLSNTKKAELNIYVQIAREEFSFFDQGIVEGEGMWYSDMKAELTNASEALAARAVTAAERSGNITKSLDEDDTWIGLTEQGVRLIKSMQTKPELLEYIEITEEVAETKERAAATNHAELTSRECLCGCKAKLTAKSNYRPGHDARHVSNLVRATKESATDQQKQIQQHASKVLSQKLFLKYMRALGK